MPSRNIEKIFLPDTYYHVYNRGVNKRRIFLDEQDYAVFLNLFKRYLSKMPVKDLKGREYPWLHNDMQLLSFCLMPNHFHLLVFQVRETAIKKLLHGVCTAYTRYFNEKYQRVGPLFQSRYKASMITSDAYLQHISRYIHLNPRDYLAWPYSSLPYYLGSKDADWVNPAKITGLFGTPQRYLDFLADEKDYLASLAQVESELADTP
jgi:putative transposase